MTVNNALAVVGSVAMLAVTGAVGGVRQLDRAAEEARAATIVGPEQSQNNCASCHALEAETWQQTRHSLTFRDRHSSERAQEVLKAMDQRSMKRGNPNTCRQCHYTSILKDAEITPTWGVSCESCHAPGRDWNAVHDKPGGVASANALKWGTARTETPAERAARLAAAASKGMIHSQMLYEIAANCFGCHTVPNETLVNKGRHHAGSDEFDLATWSQGEIRHNFVSSAGAPTKATNRPAPANQRRRLYIVGAMVDLETSVRNLAIVKEKGGAFHTAMIDRINKARRKIDAVLKAVPIPELASATAALPATVSATTAIAPGVAESLRAATRQFVATSDGSTLAAIDAQMPAQPKGTVHRP